MSSLQIFNQRWSLSLLILSGLILVSTGCEKGEYAHLDPDVAYLDDDKGQDTEDDFDTDGEGWIINDDVGTDTESDTVDSSDVESDADSPDAHSGKDIEDIEDIEGDTDSGPTEPPRCQVFGELNLEPSDLRTITADFSNIEHALQTTCAGVDGGESHAIVYRLSLPDEGSLRITPSSPVAIELRRAPCEESRRVFYCSDQGVDFENIQPLNDLHLLVQPLAGSGLTSVELEIEFEATPTCDEFGFAQCLNEDLLSKCDFTQTSPFVLRTVESLCPAGCDNNRCMGDSCANPIVVNDNIVVQGDAHILFDNHDLSGPTCRSSTIQPADYAGRELVFKIPDMGAGDRIRVDTTESENEHTVSIKSACDDSAACHGFWISNGSASWRADEAGTYYVFIENNAYLTDYYHFTIDVERN